jgi:Mn-dependent DtxR family transcriptional regulator
VSLVVSADVIRARIGPEVDAFAGVRLVTDRQQEVLDLVRAYVATHGYAPKVLELAEMLGIGGGSVWNHLKALDRKGLLVLEPRRSGGITLPEAVR